MKFDSITELEIKKTSRINLVQKPHVYLYMNMEIKFIWTNFFSNEPRLNLNLEFEIVNDY